MRFGWFLLPVFFTTCLFPANSTPRTWNIQEDGLGDAPTIQAGIDSASVGDTVLVGRGTYLEHPNFSGKDIVLKSVWGPEQTILDGSRREEPWVVGFRNQESQNAVLEGFTVTGGVGGISIWNSQPSVISNKIIDNIGAGGIVCSTDISISDPPWRPRIRNNAIEGNVSNSNGGGIFCWQKVVPEITGNLISNNSAVLGDGGGIYLSLVDLGTIVKNNVIFENVAADHGGAIYAAWSTNGNGSLAVEISMNIIRQNVAHGRAADFQGGGGIWLGGTNGWVHHNTIVGNSASDDATAAGGGIALVDETSTVVEQNIIAYSLVGDGIACFSSTPTLRNNLAWSNQPENIGGFCLDFWAGDGNIVLDPQFCDTTSGDFSLATSSPAITHPAGPLGAISAPGCTGTPVQRATWGSLKVRFKGTSSRP